MSGFSLTEYEGGEADFSAKERVLVLHSMEGTRARVNREGLEVQADTSIRYSEADGKVTPPAGGWYRVRYEGFTREAAYDACQALKAKRAPCLVIKP